MILKILINIKIIIKFLNSTIKKLKFIVNYFFNPVFRYMVYIKKYNIFIFLLKLLIIITILNFKDIIIVDYLWFIYLILIFLTIRITVRYILSKLGCSFNLEYIEHLITLHELFTKNYLAKKIAYIIYTRGNV